MVFSSVEFLFLFLPVSVGGYYLLPRPCRNFWLLAASLVFYAWGEPTFVLVMLASIAFNYVLSLVIGSFCACGHRSGARAALLLGIGGNLALLGAYKYMNFATSVLREWSPDVRGMVPQTSLILPIGISFFTFQSLSYVIDVFRGEPAQRNPLRLALYIALFPQLVAGPIVRYSDIRDQLDARRETWAKFTNGLLRFLIGVNKKVLVANTLASVSDELLGTPAPGCGLAWLGTVAFSLQMYFDFSGYSDMAIGLGRMFGFRFPENFRYPHAAATIADFWRRWHCSLTAWFRDYVYYPLGGSRVGWMRLAINITTVWALVGIWHGAGWNFIVWGLAWGVALVVEKLLRVEKGILPRIPIFRLPYRALTLLLVLVLAVFIRADGFSGTVVILKALVGGVPDDSGLTMYLLRCNALMLAVATVGSLPWMRQGLLVLARRRACGVRALVWSCQSALFFLSVSSLVMSGYNPFLYFNF